MGEESKIDPVIDTATAPLSSTPRPPSAIRRNPLSLVNVTSKFLPESILFHLPHHYPSTASTAMSALFGVLFFHTPILAQSIRPSAPRSNFTIPASPSALCDDPVPLRVYPISFSLRPFAVWTAVLLPPLLVSISLYSWVLSSLLGPSNKKFRVFILSLARTVHRVSLI
jgi:hypothetical protein